MTTARTAIEVIPNRCGSPIGTIQRHYRLSAPFERNGATYTDVVIVTGLRPGETYTYPADADGGGIAVWLNPAHLTAGGDPAALAVIGFQIVGPVPINS